MRKSEIIWLYSWHRESFWNCDFVLWTTSHVRVEIFIVSAVVVKLFELFETSTSQLLASCSCGTTVSCIIELSIPKVCASSSSLLWSCNEASQLHGVNLLAFVHRQTSVSVKVICSFSTWHGNSFSIKLKICQVGKVVLKKSLLSSWFPENGIIIKTSKGFPS